MKQLIEQYEKRINALACQYGFVDVKLECVMIEDVFNHYQIGLELGEHIFTIGIFSYEEAQGQMDKLYDKIRLHLLKIKLWIIDEEAKGDYIIVEYAYDYELISASNHKIIIHKDEYIDYLQDICEQQFSEDRIELEWCCTEDSDLVGYIKYHLKNNYLLNI